MWPFNRKQQPESASNIEDTGEDRLVTAPAGSNFKWPQGGRLTAVDELILVLPGSMIGPGEKIGSALESDDEAGVRLEFERPEDEHCKVILLRLKPGQWACVKKHCVAMLLAPDGDGDVGTILRLKIGVMHR